MRRSQRGDEGPGPSWLRLRGIGASPGVGSGPIVRLSRRSPETPRQLAPGALDTEVERLEQAARATAAELRSACETAHLAQAAGAAVLEAYAQMVADPTLLQAAIEEIRAHRRSAEWAVEAAIDQLSQQMAAAADAYLRERSLDVQFVGELLQRKLLGWTDDWIGGSAASLPVLIASDLSPARAALLRPGQVAGLVTEGGTRTSHLAVVASSMGVPCVVGCRDVVRLARGHALARVDGERGEVVLGRLDVAPSPPPEPPRRPPAVAAERRELPLQTRCGVPFELLVNVCRPEEVIQALPEGISGVGLYRSEFLLARHGASPSEQTQYESYRRVVEAAARLPVVLRTFDVGGDKFTEHSDVPPSGNPALGLRGVRWALSQPQWLDVQLRAMLRAAELGDARIVIPMVTTVDELRAVRQRVERLRRALRVRRRVPLGCMIEVPAAALRCGHLAKEADLLSIGSNDLLQYTLAADRAEPALNSLSSPFDPAALMLVKQVVEAASAADCPLSVCGVMAADPRAALLLLGLGVRSFSVEFGALRPLRATLQRARLGPLRDLAERSLELPSASAVQAQLSSHVAQLQAP